MILLLITFKYKAYRISMKGDKKGLSNIRRNKRRLQKEGRRNQEYAAFPEILWRRSGVLHYPRTRRRSSQQGKPETLKTSLKATPSPVKSTLTTF